LGTDFGVRSCSHLGCVAGSLVPGAWLRGMLAAPNWARPWRPDLKGLGLHISWVPVRLALCKLVPHICGLNDPQPFFHLLGNLSVPKASQSGRLRHRDGEGKAQILVPGSSAQGFSLSLGPTAEWRAGLWTASPLLPHPTPVCHTPGCNTCPIRSPRVWDGKGSVQISPGTSLSW
jgi:hypothetical protein